ncbi:MAG: UPF0158 family protein [Bacteroidales bacterium]
MKLPLMQIYEIAEKLNGGMKGFFNLNTGQAHWYLVFDGLIDEDEEPWEEDLSEIQENKKDYIVLQGMNFNEQFHLMADFAANINNVEIRNKLLRALSHTHPVKAFNKSIHKSGRYWQQWQDYKLQAHIDWVETWSQLIEKHIPAKPAEKRNPSLVLLEE